jgi:hypothetical protein
MEARGFTYLWILMMFMAGECGGGEESQGQQGDDWSVLDAGSSEE